MFSVDGGGEGDDDAGHSGADGLQGVFYLWEHSSRDGAVGLVSLEVLLGDDGYDTVVVVGVGEHSFFSKEKMRVTS